MELSENALTVLNERYFLKDKNEDWEKLCRRVAKAVSRDEETTETQKKWEEKYFDIIYNLRFLPNSPTLMNAGTGSGTLSACFVLDVQDNLDNIMTVMKDAALITKAAGGVGFNFSKIRPKNSIVSSTKGVASGPVSFMIMYNAMIEQIKQGGRRRGACLGLLQVDHPDIFEFIGCKKDLNKLNNFNISVAITDKFMKALSLGKNIDLIDPSTKEKVKNVSAKEIFDEIIKQAHATGEPGVVFIDKMSGEGYDSIDGVNPCGEQPLRHMESCNLGSLNLSKYYIENNFDWLAFKDDIRTATRFLDSVISINKYPLVEIKNNTEITRKIGLGLMGFADLLVLQNIRYGSDESFKIAKEIMKLIDEISKDESELLGKEKGNCKACEEEKIDRRNYKTTTIPPCGTVSMIADASSGCEPFFSIGYIKTVMGGKKLNYLNPFFLQKAREIGFELTDELIEKVVTSNSIQKIKEIPQELKNIFVTAHDVTIEDHVKMQAAFQKHIDASVSKTINMPNKSTIEDVKNAYLLAYKLGCKGITIYRDGSRPNQVLDVKKKSKYRTSKLTGSTEKIETPLGSLLLTINRTADGEVIEVIINIGKSGADIDAFCEGVGRLLSIGLQYGIPAKKLVRQLKKIGGDEKFVVANKRYSSILDFVGKRIEEYEKEREEKTEKTLALCPDCGEELYMAEGCKKCLSCGYSRC